MQVESKPAISKAVARGDLSAVKRLVEAAAAVSNDEKIKMISHARRWTEQNIAYSNEENPNGTAEWFDVTPITIASMRGHDAIVEYLLRMGADPTLKGCPVDDIELSSDEPLADMAELHMNAFDAGSKLTRKIRCCRRTRDLLMIGMFILNMFIDVHYPSNHVLYSQSSRIGNDVYIRGVQLAGTSAPFSAVFR